MESNHYVKESSNTRRNPCCVYQHETLNVLYRRPFGRYYGGGEANVSAALCNYGLNGTFVSKVPNNPIGQSAINHLRRYGVDTQFVARGGDRLGIYFRKQVLPYVPPG